MKQFLSTCLTLTLALFAFVQEGEAQSPNVLDGAYVKETNLTKRVIPYPHLREADVMYKRRIWQEIDLRQKVQSPLLLSPWMPFKIVRTCLTWSVRHLLVEGSLVAYSAGPLGTMTTNLRSHSLRTASARF